MYRFIPVAWTNLPCFFLRHKSRKEYVLCVTCHFPTLGQLNESPLLGPWGWFGVLPARPGTVQCSGVTSISSYPQNNPFYGIRK